MTDDDAPLHPIWTLRFFAGLKAEGLAIDEEPLLYTAKWKEEAKSRFGSRYPCGAVAVLDEKGEQRLLYTADEYLRERRNT